MADLASIPYHRSLEVDWASLGNASVTINARNSAGAVLVKAGRTVDVSMLFTRSLGMQVPTPNRIQAQGNVTWFWQGPREWLLVSATTDGRALADRIADELEHLTVASVDVSDRVLALEVSGPAAPALLAKGTSLDPAQLPEGGCCRTRFAGLQATVFRTGSATSFGTITDRATALHLHSWYRRAVS